MKETKFLLILHLDFHCFPFFSSCKQCNHLIRPHVVWFGESLDSKVLEAVDTALESCDLCLLVSDHCYVTPQRSWWPFPCVHVQVGTSSVVYPAAGFAPMLAMRGVPVAEFNLESTPVTGALK